MDELSVMYIYKNLHCGIFGMEKFGMFYGPVVQFVAILYI
jgi:hypothetical protein